MLRRIRSRSLRGPARHVLAPGSPTATASVERLEGDGGEGLDERSQTRQAVRGQMDRGWSKALTEFPPRRRCPSLRCRHQAPQAARRAGPRPSSSRGSDARRVRGGEWWPRYAIPNSAPDTRRRYLEVWSADLLPRLGDFELREITPMARRGLPRADRVATNVGSPTQRKALMLLQGILRRAVVRGLIPVNSAQAGRQAQAEAGTAPQPLSPVTVERIRANMLQPRTRIVPAAGWASGRAESTRLRS